MLVRLIRAWQGHKVGHALDVPDGVANLLVERIKVAEIVSDGQKPKSSKSNGTGKRARNESRGKGSSGATRKRHASRRQNNQNDSSS